MLLLGSYTLGVNVAAPCCDPVRFAIQLRFNPIGMQSFDYNLPEANHAYCFEDDAHFRALIASALLARVHGQPAPPDQVGVSMGHVHLTPKTSECRRNSGPSSGSLRSTCCDGRTCYHPGLAPLDDETLSLLETVCVAGSARAGYNGESNARLDRLAKEGLLDIVDSARTRWRMPARSYQPTEEGREMVRNKSRRGAA